MAKAVDGICTVSLIQGFNLAPNSCFLLQLIFCPDFVIVDT